MHSEIGRGFDRDPRDIAHLIPVDYAAAKAGVIGLPDQFVRDYSSRTYVTGHNLVLDGGFSIWQ